MRFDDCRDGIGTIPCPVDAVGWDSMKIACLTVITLIFYEKPDFAFEHVIDLLRSVHVGPGMVARRSQRDEKAALVSVGLPNDHRALAFSGLEHDLFLRHVLTLHL